MRIFEFWGRCSHPFEGESCFKDQMEVAIELLRKIRGKLLHIISGVLRFIKLIDPPKQYWPQRDMVETGTSYSNCALYN
jgi:hypothetical protein